MYGQTRWSYGNAPWTFGSGRWLLDLLRASFAGLAVAGLSLLATAFAIGL